MDKPIYIYRTVDGKDTVILSSYADNILHETIKEGYVDYFENIEFEVPLNWLEKMIEKTIDEETTVDEFFSEYTYDWTDGWITEAIKENVIMSEVRLF